MASTNWVLSGPDTLAGRVRRVEPAAFTRVSALGVEEQRVNVIGDLPAPPPGLGEGYRVEAAVVVSRTADAVKVPSSALFQQGAGWSVFVVRDGLIAQWRDYFDLQTIMSQMPQG